MKNGVKGRIKIHFSVSEWLLVLHSKPKPPNLKGMKGGTVQIIWHERKSFLTLEFHPLTATLATAGADFDIKFWSIKPSRTEKLPVVSYLSNLSYHSSAVNVILFSSSGNSNSPAMDTTVKTSLLTRSTNPKCGQRTGVAGMYTEFGGAVPRRPAEDMTFSVARFFHGGTNFDQTSGGPFIATSYDCHGLLDEYGRDLHKAIKLCEPALVSVDPTVTWPGKNLEDTKSSATVIFGNGKYDLPPWSISILPDCKTEVGAQSYLQKMTAVNTAFDWRSYNEEPALSSEDDPLTAYALWEQVNITLDSTDYLCVNIDTNEGFIKRGQSPVLTVMLAGHALHVFINGQLSGTVYGGLEFLKLTFSDRVKLRVGNNKPSLLSIVVGLPVSGLKMKLGTRSQFSTKRRKVDESTKQLQFEIQGLKAQKDAEEELDVTTKLHKLCSQYESKVEKEVLLAHVTKGDDVQVLGSLSVLVTLLQTKGLASKCISIALPAVSTKPLLCKYWRCILEKPPLIPVVFTKPPQKTVGNFVTPVFPLNFAPISSSFQLFHHLLRPLLEELRYLLFPSQSSSINSLLRSCCRGGWLALQWCRGNVTLFKARSSKSNTLELYFRPEDTYSYPVFGELRPTKTPLLKISKRKSPSVREAEEASSSSGMKNWEQENQPEGERKQEKSLCANIVARVTEAYFFYG
ncbi:hypothetical protein V8G54_004452 [Vigna mungo]|uniref:Beta-galactosidase n=1 Tax=Vigna mungo TaxID=3915 RepID=A0AAQ3SE75_VIGMU